MLDKEVLAERIAGQLQEKNCLLQHLYGATPLTVEEVLEEVWQYVPVFQHCICDTHTILWEKLAQNARIVFEGPKGLFWIWITGHIHM